MNVPPVDRSPATLKLNPSAQRHQADYIGEFNFRLKYLALNLASGFPDTTVFQFDTNWLFTLALRRPTSFAETSGYQDTTSFCKAYERSVLFRQFIMFVSSIGG